MSDKPEFFEIEIDPVLLDDQTVIHELLQRKYRKKLPPLGQLMLVRRSIDARGRSPKYLLRYQHARLAAHSEGITGFHLDAAPDTVHIIGAGPAGYFAALQLLSKGIRPIVFDRGKDVQARRRDLRAIMQQSIVNPDSNYCYGEGGAGTYSDGKLYTRSGKRGNIRLILQTFCNHGADPDILVNANPHIGTNKLPAIIAAMRKTIEDHGGEVHFNMRLTGITVAGDKVDELQFADGSTLPCSHLILATGHSARDIFKLLSEQGIHIAPKPFAMGCRIEHPQRLIDSIQYHCHPRPANLPAAAYSTVTQVDDHGVFSFCMCPGGMIVPAATAPGEIVVNGMSPSRRDSPYANSGFVTAIGLEDIPARFGTSALRAMYFQQEAEQKMFEMGDGSQMAPAMRITDFISGRPGNSLPDCSYVPGIYPANLSDILPAQVSQRLRSGLKATGQRMKGLLSTEGIIMGMESRTSSPVRIPRVADAMHHPAVKNLYPCGEGPGYAGGIVSAAIDGVNVANAVAARVLNA